MERTRAEPILGGGEFAREAEAEVYEGSPSDPKSPGVSGRLSDEMLGLLDGFLMGKDGMY